MWAGAARVASGLQLAIYEKMAGVTWVKARQTYGVYHSSIQNLADYFGVFRQSAQRAIASLVECGWLAQVEPKYMGNVSVRRLRADANGHKDYRVVSHEEWLEVILMRSVASSPTRCRGTAKRRTLSPLPCTGSQRVTCDGTRIFSRHFARRVKPMRPLKPPIMKTSQRWKTSRARVVDGSRTPLSLWRTTRRLTVLRSKAQHGRCPPPQRGCCAGAALTATWALH